MIGGAFLLTPGADAATNKEIIINSNSIRTSVRDVTLFFDPPAGTTEMMISNDVSFPDAPWKKYKKTIEWKLSVGKGVKTVYVRFRDAKDKESKIFKDTIELIVPKNIDVEVDINDEDEKTTSRNVTLDIEYSSGVEKIFISNTPNFTVFDSYAPAEEIPWVLSNGSGKKTVYVQFLDANGDTKTISDSILYTEPPGTLPSGSLIRSSDSSLYYLGFDGKIHPFLHSSVFHSWYTDMESVDIRQISAVALKQYSVGKPVCIRGGTWLVRFQNFPQLYAAETGCRLFPLRSEVEAQILYGKNWEDRVITLSNLESGTYSTFDRGIHDPDKDVIDVDRDGLDEETEEVYGTSDKLPDTDGDGLSDLEEVFAWLTDPTLVDSDSDGTHDMQDVIDTYISTHGNDLDLSEMYSYPSGLILQDRYNLQFFMSYIDHRIYFVGKTARAKAFSTNEFSNRFVRLSSPFLPIKPRSGWSVREYSLILKNPAVVSVYGNLQTL